jgi:hypothetical protein
MASNTEAPKSNTEKITQDRVDYVLRLFKQNSTDLFVRSILSNDRKRFETGHITEHEVERAIINFDSHIITPEGEKTSLITQRQTNKDIDPGFQNPSEVQPGQLLELETEIPRFLASVAKTALMRAYFEDFGTDDVQVDFRVIKELLGYDGASGRSPMRMFGGDNGFKVISPTYINALNTLYDFATIKRNQHIILAIQNLLNGNFNASNRELILSFIRILSDDDAKQIQFKMDAREFRDLTLDLSCNSTSTIAREHIQQRMAGSNENTFEEYKRRMDELIPGYVPLLTLEGGHHWIQPDGNTGPISGFTEMMHGISTGNLHRDPGSIILFESLQSNIDFGHTFRQSSLGKALISQGWLVPEKTGYLQLVMNSSYLAKEGMPPHMTLSTVFSVISPEGKVYSFGFNMSIEMALPWTEKQYYSIDFPNDENAEYKKYYNEVFSYASKIFRQRCETEVKKVIGSEFREN